MKQLYSGYLNNILSLKTLVGRKLRNTQEKAVLEGQRWKAGRLSLVT